MEARFRDLVKSTEKRAVTIQDVADAAGVSVSTVSRVLNDKDDVAPETYEEVRRVIRELDYTSSLAAKSMRSRQTNVIGLTIDDVEDPFSVQVMKGINRAIVKLDYDLMLCTGGDFKRESADVREQRYVSLLSSITDGIIVVTPVAETFSAASPIVVVDPNRAGLGYPAVIATNRAGAMEAVAYLIDLGHRRIGFIGGRPELQSAAQRLQGYKDALLRAGLPVVPDLIQTGDYSTEMGFLCAQRLLNLSDPPTAVFAANDQSALGAIKAAQEAGLCVPADLSVVGFDNIPQPAHVGPRLTTVDQFIERMGYVATMMLIRLIHGEPLESEVYEMPTQLVIGDSCRAVVDEPGK
jgi:LacI family transcriptional regulator